MSFFVPEQYFNLFAEVEQRFRLLIQKQVVTGLDELRFDTWLSNFTSIEDQYLAGRLLNGLIFRSKAMIYSSIDHLLQCVLPGELRRASLFPYSSIEEFLDSLAAGSNAHPVRFVAIDGSSENEEPGKSGVLIIRHFRQHARISKSLTCRPERIESLPETVRCLIFVDDVVGTGSQFKKFAELYKLSEQSSTRMLIYCPLVGFSKGVKAIEKKCDWLTVRPIELLDANHQFYHGAESDPKLWAADETNTIVDVRRHLTQLAQSRGIPPSTNHSLDLLLGFEHATPNNSLPLLWARSSDWSPLLIR